MRAGDLAPHVPEGSWIMGCDADHPVRLPCSEILEGPSPGIPLERLADLAPDCFRVPRNERVKLSPAMLALRYRMIPRRELEPDPHAPAVPEPEPLGAPDPLVPEPFASEWAVPQELDPTPAEAVIEAAAPAEEPVHTVGVAEMTFAGESASTEAVAEPPAESAHAIPVEPDVPTEPVAPAPEVVSDTPQANAAAPADVEPATARSAPAEHTTRIFPGLPLFRRKSAPAPELKISLPPPPAPVIPAAPRPPEPPPSMTARLVPRPRTEIPRPRFGSGKPKFEPTLPHEAPSPIGAPAFAPAEPVAAIPEPPVSRPSNVPIPTVLRALEPLVGPPRPSTPVPLPPAVPASFIPPPPAPAAPEPAIIEPELPETPAPRIGPDVLDPGMSEAPVPVPAAPEPKEPEPAVLVRTGPRPGDDVHDPTAPSNQDELQALFLTEEFLSVDRVLELCGGFPGVNACVLAHGAAVVGAHNVPESFDLVSLSAHAVEMLNGMRQSAAKMGIGAVPAVTIHSEKGPITFFHESDFSLFVFHKDRMFVPGVREKLEQVVGALASSKLPRPVTSVRRRSLDG